MIDEALLDRLLEASRKLAENRLLDPLLNTAMQTALELFRAEYGYLVLLDNHGALKFHVRLSDTGDIIPEPDAQVSHTILEKVIGQRAPLLTADAQLEPGLTGSESVRALHLHSVMCVPLIARGRLLGAIYLENRSARGVFLKTDLKPLEYFAGQAAVSIDNALLYDELEAVVGRRTSELKHAIEQLEQRTAELIETNHRLAAEVAARQHAEEELHRLAITDSLTNLYNRRHFFELAERMFRRARQSGEPMALLMLDVDHFKDVNDQYGHTAGDEVLQALGKLLGESLRPGDIVARYGGEEFVALLPHTPLKQASQAAERIRKQVAANPFAISHPDTRPATGELQAAGLPPFPRKLPEPDAIPLTVSIGVASINPPRLNLFSQLIRQADLALYAAKQAGRNRIQTYLTTP